ncbi:MAG: hypothetical protein HY741_19670 [Chloroflexi bacterium]|nr:hypothetical protein [Chloroflexota bacterium]
MNAITLLVELQNMDMRSDENTVLRAATEKSLADTADLNAARAVFAQSDTRTTELKAQLRSLELETQGLAEKIKQVNERLYSGRITNAKELAGLNQDEKMLQRRKRELEDHELALMEQIEAADNLAAAKRAALETISAQTNARHDKDRAALLALDALDAALAHKRAGLRAQLDANTLRVYDTLRVTKKGRAVAPMKNSSCSACGFAVPSGLASRLKTRSELVYCVNCERILAPSGSRCPCWTIPPKPTRRRKTRSCWR